MKVDVAIIGAGIIGLAHAVHAARAGLSVAVFERNPRANGASVRNFGMLAVIAQAPGDQLQTAIRTLDLWRDVAGHAGFAVEPSGCVFVARHPEEMSVLAEFAGAAPTTRRAVDLLAREDLNAYVPPLSDGVIGGLWSPHAYKVDQRQSCAKIADWLKRAYDVQFHFSTEVLAVNAPYLDTTIGQVEAGHVILCGGDDFATLYPDAFAEAGVTRCQLQMMRTHPQPEDWRLRPFLLGGLSIPRYGVFSECPSLAALIAKQQRDQAECLANGIHVIVCQELDGSVTIGDSHSYGDAIPSVRSETVDTLITDDLAGMIALPETRIAERWVGHYAHLAGTEKLVLQVADGVTAVTMTNGQGMTHGFAVAESVIENITA